jgi:hypothetical protein
MYLVPISAGTPAMVKVLRGFCPTLQANTGIMPQLDHNRFLPNPLQFIMPLDPI